jgi:hypothetical protein
MRIATWNLNSHLHLCEARRAAILAAVGRVDADVWVLTETWAGFQADGGFSLPDVYRRVAQSAPAADLAEIRRIMKEHEAKGYPLRDVLKALLRSKAFLEYRDEIGWNRDAPRWKISLVG